LNSFRFEGYQNNKAQKSVKKMRKKAAKNTERERERELKQWKRSIEKMQ